jgi:hypothetical protein
MNETTTSAAAVASAAPERPLGPAAAVVLATGIGALTLGILTTLAEASTGTADFLQFNDRVGPLSGKTIISTAVFFGAWALLTALWRGKNPPLRPILIATAVLLALGLLGTFPTFFEAFASD